MGYYIVEFEQYGKDRAKYGEKLLKQLASSINRRGLGERRLYEYRLTYQNPLERAFYEQETIRSCWTVTELDRQVSSLEETITEQEAK